MGMIVDPSGPNPFNKKKGQSAEWTIWETLKKILVSRGITTATDIEMKDNPGAALKKAAPGMIAAVALPFALPSLVSAAGINAPAATAASASGAGGVGGLAAVAGPAAALEPFTNALKDPVKALSSPSGPLDLPAIPADGIQSEPGILPTGAEPVAPLNDQASAAGAPAQAGFNPWIIVGAIAALVYFNKN